MPSFLSTLSYMFWYWPNWLVEVMRFWAA